MNYKETLCVQGHVGPVCCMLLFSFQGSSPRPATARRGASIPSALHLPPSLFTATPLLRQAPPPPPSSTPLPCPSPRTAKQTTVSNCHFKRFWGGGSGDRAGGGGRERDPNSIGFFFVLGVSHTPAAACDDFFGLLPARGGSFPGTRPCPCPSSDNGTRWSSRLPGLLQFQFFDQKNSVFFEIDRDIFRFFCHDCSSLCDCSCL